MKKIFYKPNFLKKTFGVIFLIILIRIVPHSPNFTSIIALSFYIPAFMGRKFIFPLMIGFGIADLILGFHQVILFTWGSILMIGFFSKFFAHSLQSRFLANILASILFFLISNFGVWLTGVYSYSLEGLIICYTFAIPFFNNTLISTILYSIVIEAIYKFYKRYRKNSLINI